MGQVKNVKLEDIARELGVSIVSVSNALNGRKGVGENLRLRVLKKAEELGYQVEAGPARARSRAFCVGVVIAERYVKIYPSFYMDIYRQVAQEASRRGCLTVLNIIDTAEEKSGQRIRPFADMQVHGILIIGEMNPGYVEQIHKKSGVPVVCVDFYEAGRDMDYIVMNNFHGMQKVTQRVIDCGHRDIGFVGTPQATGSIMDRYMGYVKAMERNGLTPRAEWLLYDRAEDGYSTVLNLELPRSLPTAFVCNCDRSASLLIERLTERGVCVPEDISVAGFDHSYSRLGDGLEVTTYECDERVLAQISLKTLLRRIEGKSGPAGIRIVEGEIVEGNTVVPFAEEGR